MIINTLSFVAVLGFLIFFHELGHFLVAKFFGVGIEKFSLGFGPRIFGYRSGITDYRVSAIPLGGYVKMVGDESDSELDDEILSFVNKSVLKKFMIVLAGPAFNIFLSIAVLFVIFSTSGIFVLKPIIGEVIPGMPAERSGIESGDLILTVNDLPVNNWNSMARMISSSGEGIPIKVEFDRDGVSFMVMIDPLLAKTTNIFGQEISEYVIGIMAAGDVTCKKLNCLEAFLNSLSKTYEIAYLTGSGVIKLLQGSLSTKTLGGPVMIAEMVGYHARAGFVDLMFFVALLSINLAVLNCLPIPVLDGGHLVFFAIEGIIRKPINAKFKELTHQVGALILFGLMIFVFYNDIIRLFSD